MGKLKKLGKLGKNRYHAIGGPVQHLYLPWPRLDDGAEHTPERISFGALGEYLRRTVDDPNHRYVYDWNDGHSPK